MRGLRNEWLERMEMMDPDTEENPHPLRYIEYLQLECENLASDLHHNKIISAYERACALFGSLETLRETLEVLGIKK